MGSRSQNMVRGLHSTTCQKSLAVAVAICPFDVSRLVVVSGRPANRLCPTAPTLKVYVNCRRLLAHLIGECRWMPGSPGHGPLGPSLKNSSRRVDPVPDTASTDAKRAVCIPKSGAMLIPISRSTFSRFSSKTQQNISRGGSSSRSSLLSRFYQHAMTAAVTSAEILQHTSAFLSEALSNPDLRHHILSAARLKIPASDQSTLRTLAIASDSLENAISVANPATRSSSLRLTEKLLLSSSLQTSLSSLLLSLIYSLCQHPTEAALCLLDVFLFDPSLARSEIAPSVFEDLFLLHLLPVLLWFKDQRSRIHSSVTPDRSSYGDDERSAEAEAGRRGMLSRMSGEQAAKLKGLEKDYEEVVDENSRNFARYLKEVLGDSDGIGSSSAPSLILGTIGDGDAGSDASSRRSRAGSEADGMNEHRQIGTANRRYNVMFHFS
ncbi:hypothetical protein ACLOJK_040237 [Asimina triloba]